MKDANTDLGNNERNPAAILFATESFASESFAAESFAAAAPEAGGGGEVCQIIFEVSIKVSGAWRWKTPTPTKKMLNKKAAAINPL